MKKKHPDIFLILISLLGLVIIVNSILVLGLSKKVSEAIVEAKEKARPADIEFTVIIDKECVKCFDVKTIIESIKNDNNVKNEDSIDFREPDAQNMISDYDIEKIPSIVVKGELEKVKLSGFEKREDAMVLQDIEAPYTSAVDGKIRGLVKLIHIKDSECDKCFDLTNAIRQLKESIVIERETIVESDSEEGRGLIKKYNLKKIPAIILSQDFSYYPMVEFWSQIGTVEEDGNYLMVTASPPYVNTTTNKVIGLVELTYLTDKSCIECYDITNHKKILLRYGIDPVSEKRVDINTPEGKELIKKYDINAAPTIILSRDVSYYTTLITIWSQVGYIAEDGSYVFTKVDAMGKYINVTTGAIVG